MAIIYACGEQVPKTESPEVPIPSPIFGLKKVTSSLSPVYFMGVELPRLRYLVLGARSGVVDLQWHRAEGSCSRNQGEDTGSADDCSPGAHEGSGFAEGVCATGEILHSSSWHAPVWNVRVRSWGQEHLKRYFFLYNFQALCSSYLWTFVF